MEPHPPIPPEHVPVAWDAYTLVIHPGIHRTVRIDDLPAYRQVGVHTLIGMKPPDDYHLGIYGGPLARTVTLEVGDPDVVVESVTLTLKPDGAAPGERVRFETGALTCPPFCG